MNKTKFFTLATIVLVLLNVATLAFFWSKKPPRPQGEGPKKIIIERLHFDAGQVAAYEKLIAQHQAIIAEKGQKIAAAKEFLYAQLAGDDLSKKDSMVNVIGQLQMEMEQVHFHHFVDLKALCKREQVGYFEALTTDLAKFFAPQGRLPGKPGQ